ncbi:MAG: hypothetical protein ABI723_00855 [Bacteroidia bacterium]
MNTKNKITASVTPLIISILILCLTFLSACKKNDSSDSSNPTPTPNYCADGVQNNGETGIDCGGTCTSCANAFNFTLPFYLQFKNNGSYTHFQDSVPQYSQTTNNGNTIAQTAFSLLFNSTHAVEIKFAGAVSSLAGKSLSLNYTTVPSAKVIFFDGSGNELYTSEMTSNQTGSNFYVESVTLVSSYTWGSFTIDIYSVKGNFNCKVSDAGQTVLKDLNYGKFSLKVQDMH